MKRISFLKSFAALMIGVCFSSAGLAQSAPPASPAATATGKIGEATVTINYSSPAVKGRKIFGGLVPYNKVWRAGANAATTFEVDKDVMVEGKTLPAGKYAFFVMPAEGDWTVIFSKVASQMGAFNYDQAQDALRVNVKPRKKDTLNERLAYLVNKKGIVLQWENVEVPVTIK